MLQGMTVQTLALSINALLFLGTFICGAASEFSGGRQIDGATFGFLMVLLSAGCMNLVAVFS